MGNKCPNCGYEYGENDAFCAMCGAKLNSDYTQEQFQAAKELVLNNIENFSNTSDTIKPPLSAFAKDPNADSSLFNFVISLAIISLIMCASMYLVIDKQADNKYKLHYKNLISNPDKIPELKEPSSFKGLKQNLGEVEEFLVQYLKYSPDTDEKKQQVFISYLKEMDKLPYITTENFVNIDSDYSSKPKTAREASKQARKLAKEYKSIGIGVYCEKSTIHLYPNYKFISKKYSPYLSGELRKYLKLRSKYSYPVALGLEIYSKPKKIADKIYDFEKLYTKVSDVYIRDEILRIIYEDFRTLIFSPSIYATTTQEMKKEFKNTYIYFIRTKKLSQLRPVVMSYLDKQRAYSEENFKNDYPYQAFSDTLEANVDKYTLQDVFLQLRKGLFDSSAQKEFKFIYNIISGSWKNYDKNYLLKQGEYVITAPDENNNVLIYDNKFSLTQELNISKYAKLYLINGTLCVYNSDRLSLSKVTFNGKLYSLQQMNSSDVTSLIPGVDIIYIDSYQNYLIEIQKLNYQAAYIILSRYSQGYNSYSLTSDSPNVSIKSLPNLFTVSSDEDAVVYFKNLNVGAQETSDNTPTYKFKIHTFGSPEQEEDDTGYDEKTAKQDNSEYAHNPNIMPKIIKDDDSSQENEKAPLQSAPTQEIEPPKD